MDDRIRWAPKVKQAKIWRLYQLDALGIVDEDLIDDVGTALHARCHSVLLVSRAQVECPRCGRLIDLGRKHTDKAEDIISCPDAACGWQSTRGQYHNSWRHQDLIGSRAETAFQSFEDQYRSHLPPDQKMLLIDQLIQAFHQGIIANVGHRTAANNLIEGNHEQVVAFLEKLAGNAQNPQDKEAWEAWTLRANEMKQARKRI